MKIALRRHSKIKSIKFTESFRTIEKLFNYVNSNLEQLTLQSKERKLGREILDLLGPNHSSLFFEYESSVYLTESFCIESAYRLGVEDGKMGKNSPFS